MYTVEICVWAPWIYTVKWENIKIYSAGGHLASVRSPVLESHNSIKVRQSSVPLHLCVIHMSICLFLRWKSKMSAQFRFTVLCKSSCCGILEEEGKDKTGSLGPVRHSRESRAAEAWSGLGTQTGEYCQRQIWTLLWCWIWYWRWSPSSSTETRHGSQFRTQKWSLQRGPHGKKVHSHSAVSTGIIWLLFPLK